MHLFFLGQQEGGTRKVKRMTPPAVQQHSHEAKVWHVVDQTLACFHQRSPIFWFVLNSSIMWKRRFIHPSPGSTLHICPLDLHLHLKNYELKWDIGTVWIYIFITIVISENMKWKLPSLYMKSKGTKNSQERKTGTHYRKETKYRNPKRGRQCGWQWSLE